MIVVRIEKSRLEDWCDNVPECCSFMRRFFIPARQGQDYHKTLGFYMDSITKGITDERYAKQYKMSSAEFEFFHKDLMDAFHDIVKLDWKNRPTVY